MKRHAWVDALNEAMSVAYETLSLIAPGRRDDDKFHSLVPRHITEAKTADCRSITHCSAHP